MLYHVNTRARSCARSSSTRSHARAHRRHPKTTINTHTHTRTRSRPYAHNTYAFVPALIYRIIKCVQTRTADSNNNTLTLSDQHLHTHTHIHHSECVRDLPSFCYTSTHTYTNTHARASNHPPPLLCCPSRPAQISRVRECVLLLSCRTSVCVWCSFIICRPDLHTLQGSRVQHFANVYASLNQNTPRIYEHRAHGDGRHSGYGAIGLRRQRRRRRRRSGRPRSVAK